MKEFYQQLQSNPNKAYALRNAMLKTMKKYPDRKTRPQAPVFKHGDKGARDFNPCQCVIINTSVLY
jgi:hypothetical protein